MGKISAFITGAAVGMAAALLLAPRSGEETRAFVAEKAGAIAGEAKDFGAGIPGSAQDMLKTARDKGASVIKGTPAKVQDIAGNATGKSATVDSDELREKIEAARKRIAAQVMENAEQNKAVDVAAEAKEVKEAVAESVSEVAEEAKEAVEEVKEAAEEAAEEAKAE